MSKIGTINVKSKHVYQNVLTLAGVAKKLEDRFQKYPIKIGRVEDIIDNFSANYFSTDTDKAHPYYFAVQNSNTEGKFDFNNSDITFLTTQDDRIGFTADGEPVYIDASDTERHQMDMDKYGFANPASISNNRYQTGAANTAVTIVQTNTMAAYPETNFINRLKSNTLNSKNIEGIKAIEDRGSLLIPSEEEMRLYYQEYLGSGTIEGAYTYSSSSTNYSYINSSQFKDGIVDVNVTFRYPYKPFDRVRYKRRVDDTYSTQNAYFCPYDLWLFISETYPDRTYYRLISRTGTFSTFAFLQDDAGDLWILSVSKQVETRGNNYLLSGDNYFYFLYKVKDMPTNGFPEISMYNRFDTDEWTTTTTLTYVDDNVYDINGTWQELLAIGEGPDEPSTDIDNPYEDIAESETGGGEDATLDWTSDEIPEDEIRVPAVAGPMVHIYELGISPSTTLSQLNTYMWSSDFLQALSNSYSDVKSAIVGLYCLPYNVTKSGNTGHIIMCGRDTEINANVGVSDFQLFDMGTIQIPKFYDSYLDYAPYTSAQIYLPFIGTRDLNINEVMGKTLSLKYYFNNLTGSCVARLYANGNFIDCYEGQCSLNFPTSSADRSNMLFGAIMAAGGIAAMAGGLASIGTAVLGPTTAAVAGSGALAGAKATAIGAGAAIMGGGTMDKQTISKSGNITGSASWYCHRTPYITITSPRLSMPSNKLSEIGGIVNRGVKVSDLGGFAKFKAIHVDKVHCTDEERDMITSLMMGGIII